MLLNQMIETRRRKDKDTPNGKLTKDQAMKVLEAAMQVNYFLVTKKRPKDFKLTKLILKLIELMNSLKLHFRFE